MPSALFRSRFGSFKQLLILGGLLVLALLLSGCVEKADWEADRLVQSGERFGPQRVLLASFPARTLPELRALAEALRRQPGLAAVLATHDGQKVAVIAACAPGAGLSARELLARLLSASPPLGWRGGGDEQLAQGGGAADEEGYQRFLESAKSILAE